jgi:hypothetical protein
MRARRVEFFVRSWKDLLEQEALVGTDPMTI